MQQRIRRFIREHSRETGATVLLTSHYMADIVALCERVIVIHEGSILYDGPLARLADRFGGLKTITVLTDSSLDTVGTYGTSMVVEERKVIVTVDKTDVSRVAQRLLTEMNVLDISITDPPIEDVIADIFNSTR